MKNRKTHGSLSPVGVDGSIMKGVGRQSWKFLSDILREILKELKKERRSREMCRVLTKRGRNSLKNIESSSKPMRTGNRLMIPIERSEPSINMQRIISSGWNTGSIRYGLIRSESSAVS